MLLRPFKKALRKVAIGKLSLLKLHFGRGLDSMLVSVNITSIFKLILGIHFMNTKIVRIYCQFSNFLKFLTATRPSLHKITGIVSSPYHGYIFTFEIDKKMNKYSYLPK